MSNVEDDGLFREVDEELRQERLKNLWDKYGPMAMGAAVLLVVSVGGLKYYNWQAANTAANSGVSLLQASGLTQNNKQDDASQMLQALATNGPANYQALANLQIASLEAAKGNSDNALKSYQRVAKASGTDKILKDFASLQMVMINMEKLPVDEAIAKLKPVAEGKGTWRFMARELMALAYYKAGDMVKAKENYGRLLLGNDVPQSMRKRAGQMQALLNAAASATPAKGTKGQAAKSEAQPAKSESKTGKNAATEKK